MHYINIDEPAPGVAESARQRADDAKSEIFPKPQGSFVGSDDEVELHRSKTETGSFAQTMLSHCSPDSATSGRSRNHEAGISDMRSKPGLVGFENVTANYSLIGKSDVTARFWT
jgi:hypothetical protein